MRRLSAWLLLAVLVAACAEPPNKEINQAQGAIDAAKAAGADRYADTEYQAATTSLELANDAVTQGDYRLALNHALESREHAQNAAREAGDRRAELRTTFERARIQIDARLAQAETRIAALPKTRAGRRTATAAQQRLSEIQAQVQKADARMRDGDALAATDGLKGITGEIEDVLASLTPTGSQSPRSAR